MEKKLLEKLADATLFVTITVALMYYWGRQYISGYLKYFGLSANQFDVSFADYTAQGVYSLIILVVGIIAFCLSSLLWERFNKKEDPADRKVSKNLQALLATAKIIGVIGVIFYVAFYSRYYGTRDAMEAQASATVQIKTSSDLVFQGEPHLLLKLGGDYLIYDNCDPDESLVHIIPQEQVLQISHLISK